MDISENKTKMNAKGNPNEKNHGHNWKQDNNDRQEGQEGQSEREKPLP